MSLVAESVGVQRGGRVIIRSVSLTCAPGEVVGLLGPNGAGKSTLLHAVAGGLPLMSGRVWIDGQERACLPRTTCAQQIAVLAQRARLEFDLPVHEVVRLGRLPWGDERSPRASRVVAAALAAVGLEARAAEPIGTLSGGQQQRVHLARALAQLHRADAGPTGYLLLDEPSAHQDPQGTARVLACARRAAAQGCGVICVLHDLNLAASAFDRLLLLRAGEVVAQGPPASVLQAGLLTDVYQTPLRVLHAAAVAHPLVLHAARTGGPS